MKILLEDWFRDLTNEKKLRPAGPARLPLTRRSNWKSEGYLPNDGWRTPFAWRFFCASRSC
jgi:hypothetical protein